MLKAPPNYVILYSGASDHFRDYQYIRDASTHKTATATSIGKDDKIKKYPNFA